MVYTKSDAPVQKSIDTAGTETANTRRYRNNNAQVYLNPDGLPVAFRRVRSLQKPGSFASWSRHQLVTPRKVASVSRKCFDAYRKRYAPLN